MIYVNYMLMFLAMALVGAEVYLILKRNKTILVKGKEDFFSFALVMLFVIVIFPLSESVNLVEILRNILVLLVLFGSIGVKRGLCAKGICKSFYVIPWEAIEEIKIEEYQISKISVQAFAATGKKYQLLFHKYQLKKLLWELEQHMDREHIYLQDGLETVLDSKTN